MRVALVTGAGERTLGAATADALRARDFRVLTTTRTCAVTGDTHPLDLTSRESVVDRKSTRLNSSHVTTSRMPSSA